MRQITHGSTNISVDVYIVDSTDGTPETGVLFNTSGMDLEYHREGAAVVNVTEVTLASLTTAHADGGFLEIGHGYYRFDVPDAAFASGAKSVSVQGTVTGMVVLPMTYQLTAFDMDTASAAQTADNNVLAAGSAGFAAIDTVVDTILSRVIGTIESGSHNPASTAQLGALTDWLNGGRLDLLLDAIPTTAMRGTDSAALASVCTETRLQALTDWLNGGRLDLLLDAIPTTAMRGTDSALLASAINTSGGAVTTVTNVTNQVTADATAIAGVTAAATNLSKSAIGIESGAAITGTLSITQMTTDLTEATDDHYNGRIIIWTSGVLKNQATDITDYTGATKLLTYTATTEAPSNTDTFVIV